MPKNAVAMRVSWHFACLFIWSEMALYVYKVSWFYVYKVSWLCLQSFVVMSTKFRDKHFMCPVCVFALPVQSMYYLDACYTAAFGVLAVVSYKAGYFPVVQHIKAKLPVPAC